MDHPTRLAEVRRVSHEAINIIRVDSGASSAGRDSNVHVRAKFCCSPKLISLNSSTTGSWALDVLRRDGLEHEHQLVTAPVESALPAVAQTTSCLHGS
jgi:hypothetical protein